MIRLSSVKKLGICLNVICTISTSFQGISNEVFSSCSRKKWLVISVITEFSGLSMRPTWLRFMHADMQAKQFVSTIDCSGNMSLSLSEKPGIMITHVLYDWYFAWKTWFDNEEHFALLPVFIVLCYETSYGKIF